MKTWIWDGDTNIPLSCKWHQFWYWHRRGYDPDSLIPILNFSNYLLWFNLFISAFVPLFYLFHVNDVIMLHINFIQFHILQFGHWSDDQEEKKSNNKMCCWTAFIFLFFFFVWFRFSALISSLAIRKSSSCCKYNYYIAYIWRDAAEQNKEWQFIFHNFIAYGYKFFFLFTYIVWSLSSFKKGRIIFLFIPIQEV